MFHEINGQPIEQFGMRRQVALHTEIPCRFNDAFAENLLPNLVYKNAGSEGIRPINRPPRKPQPMPP